MKYDGSEPLGKLQHEEFCHKFIRTRSITKAGLEVGINQRQNANSIHKREDVQARINFLRQELLDELGLDNYYVLSGLKSVAERCMQAEDVCNSNGEPVVIRTEDGELKAMYKFEHTGANKALELIGKYIGMFNDKVKHEHTGADGKPISLNLEVVFTDESNQSTD